MIGDEWYKLKNLYTQQLNANQEASDAQRKSTEGVTDNSQSAQNTDDEENNVKDQSNIETPEIKGRYN